MNLDKLTEELRDVIGDANKVNYGKDVYLAGGWFSEDQETALLSATYNLADNPSVGHIHIPLLHQYMDSNPIVDGEFKPDQEWATATFLNDVEAINQADVVVALLEAKNQDTGTVWEMAYAYATHKPVIAIVDGDVNKYPVNLMPAQSVTHFSDNIGELEEINLYEIGKKFYKGALI